MKQLTNKFYKIIVGIMIVLWGIITFSSCFHVYGRSYNPAIIIIGAIIFYLIIYNFYKAISKTTSEKHNKIAFGIFAIVLSLIMLWGVNTQIVPAYDLSHIMVKSDEMLGNHFFGSDLYFSIYPTQIPITILVYFIKSIGGFIGFTNPAEFMIIYNAFMTSLMLLFIYKIGSRISNSKIGLTMMLIAAMYPDFYLYASYYYTDIVSLPFAILGYYLILKSEEETKKGKLFFAGLLFGIGFKLRVTVLILLIAYIVCMLRNYSIKSLCKNTFIILFGVFISIFTFNKLIYPIFQIELNENVKVPATHWIMMGVNKDTDGGYSDADINYSINSINKNKDIFKVIKSRIPKLDISFFYNKIRKVWSEGDHDIQRKYALTTKMNGLRLVTRGELSGIGRNYAQILKFAIYLLFMITLIKEFLHHPFWDSINAEMIVCIFGAIIFYLIWEALSRYSFSFLPIIILGTSYGIESLTNLLDKKKIEKFDFIKIKKITGIFLISILSVAIIGSIIYYSNHPKNMEIDRNSQIYSTRTYTPLYRHQSLKQVFRVSDDFDCIELKFMTDKLIRPTNYRYVILKDKEIIHKGFYLFEPNFSKIVRKIKIEFEKIEVEEESEFTLLFYSATATEDNYVSINSYELKQTLKNSDTFSPEFYGSGYDINPHAETYFKGELSEGNIYFRAFERKKQNILDNRGFIIVAFFVILIVMYNIFICLLKRRNE